MEEVDTLVYGKFCSGQIQVVNLKKIEFKIDHQCMERSVIKPCLLPQQGHWLEQTTGQHQ